MNIGTIITRALNRAGLSVADYATREMANDFLDEIIQGIWESKRWNFRKRLLTLTTAASTEEYALDKRARVSNITPNTIRGADPVRRIRYEPSLAFYKKRPFELEGGNPYFLRDGEFRGYSTAPSSASAITFVSSLTNQTTGTVSVVRGQTRVVMTTGTVSVDKLGQWIRIGSDTKAYKVTKLEYNSTSIFYLNEPYQGSDNSSASYVLGDIYQRVTVLGYVSGQLTEEEVQLNGSTSVVTTKSFTSIVRLSKSDKTHGYITATSNSGAVTNGILDPGEMDLDIQTVKLYPVPAAVETISYECYITHPSLYKYSDSPLIPQEHHDILVIDLYIRLEEEWNKKEVSQNVISKRSELYQSMVAQDNNTDGWMMQQENYEDSDYIGHTNLPTTYDSDGAY